MFTQQPAPDPTLANLLKQAKNHKMTSEEIRLQRVSFAYGNLALHDPCVTREMVEATDKELHPEDYR